MTRRPRQPRPNMPRFGQSVAARSRAPTSLALLLSVPAFAPVPALAADQGEETVVVTATKRAQNAQDVPLSLTAITGDELDRKGLRRWEDALEGEPSIVVTPSGNSSIGSNIAIRGVSDGADGGLTQSAVAMYIDEMPVTVAQSTGNPSLLLYDIDKITVIRGPRSTLYGSSSLGGTVKIETLNPSLSDTKGFAHVGYGRPSSSDSSNTDLAASLSTPIAADVAAIGVTAYRVENGGVIDSPTLGKDVDGTTTKGARIALFAKPAAGLSINAKLYAQDYDNRASSAIDPRKGGELVAPPTAVLEAGTDRFRGATVTIRYTTDSFEFVSATTRFDKTLTYTSDLTSRFGPILTAFGVPTGTPIVVEGSFASKVTSQELRLVSSETRTGPFWSAGLFYSDESTDNDASTPSPVGEVFGSLSTFNHKQAAAFGEGGFKFAHGLELGGGLRITEYKSADEINLLGLFAVPGTRNVNSTEKPVTPYLSAAYHIDRQLLYVQASKGSRPGKGNFPVIPVPGYDVPGYASADSLWTYEAGAKTSWMDNRVTANLAIYYTDWKNAQLTLTLPTSFTYINSIGSLNPGAGVAVKGIDFELAARPAPGLRLSAALGYVDSTFTKDITALDPTGAVVTEGSRLAGIPRLTANSSLRYDFALVGRPSTFDATVRHVGSYYSDYNSATKQLIGKRTTLDLRLGTRFAENIDLALYMNNATNEHPFVTQTLTLRPRTAGIAGTYTF
ncbi:MAG: TonB-dependent receptor [Gammaproteobacteria bacterium]